MTPPTPNDLRHVLLAAPSMTDERGEVWPAKYDAKDLEGGCDWDNPDHVVVHLDMTVEYIDGLFAKGFIRTEPQKEMWARLREASERRDAKTSDLEKAYDTLKISVGVGN